ncbi:unnamed protein product [Acanthosepion pharaonis]|uniref:Uncharacterized protein n=1 Tax=Acanthosepion pharaonis TaxID=158019 RepID=A0A812DJD4_ACAPH|nr:unnamed protein product [Sepia pharaonis]
MTTLSKPTTPFVEELCHKIARIKYAPTRQQPTDSYIPQHLRDCEFVFVRNDAVRRPLTPAYQGPFQVLRRTDKHLTIKRANTTDTVANDRTKPAFLAKRQYNANPAPRAPDATPAHPAHAAPQTSDDTPATSVQQTRSGIRPNRLDESSFVIIQPAAVADNSPIRQSTSDRRRSAIHSFRRYNRFNFP